MLQSILLYLVDTMIFLKYFVSHGLRTYAHYSTISSVWLKNLKVNNDYMIYKDLNIILYYNY